MSDSTTGAPLGSELTFGLAAEDNRIYREVRDHGSAKELRILVDSLLADAARWRALAEQRRRLRWRGMPGHFIAADKCCFHMVTDVDGYRVSTIGCYHPEGYDHRSEIGSGRLYETMVFKIGPDDEIVPSELDAAGYNDEAAAEAGHMAMLDRWICGPPAAREALGENDGE